MRWPLMAAAHADTCAPACTAGGARPRWLHRCGPSESAACRLCNTSLRCLLLSCCVAMVRCWTVLCSCEESDMQYYCMLGGRHGLCACQPWSLLGSASGALE